MDSLYRHIERCVGFFIVSIFRVVRCYSERMRHIQSIDEFLLQCGALIRYVDGGYRVALKLWHTRWHRWYLLLPPRHGVLVECCKRDDENDD